MNLQQKTVIVFTGGGETSVLNSTLYGVISEAKKKGMRILGGMRGWASLLDDGVINDITSVDVEGIENIGGTFLSTSRTNPFAIPNGIEQLKKKIAKHHIDFIVSIGGNDTMGASRKLYDALNFPIVSAPKTMDNDLCGTYFSPGYPSMAYNVIDACNRLKRDCAIPRRRIYLLEVQEAQAGWVSASAILGRADLIITAQHKLKLSSVLQKIKALHDANNGGIIVVSKEAKFDKVIGQSESQNDGYGVIRQQFVSIGLQNLIKKKYGINAQVVIPSNLFRCGPPIKLERDIGIALGRHTIQLLQQQKYGQMAAVKLAHNQLFYMGNVPLSEAVDNYFYMDDDMYDYSSMLPTQKFLDYIKPIFREKVLQDDFYYNLVKKLN